MLILYGKLNEDQSVLIGVNYVHPLCG